MKTKNFCTVRDHELVITKVNEDAIVRTKAYKLSDSEYVIELYTTDGQMTYLVYPSKEEQAEVLDYIWSEEED